MGRGERGEGEDIAGNTFRYSLSACIAFCLTMQEEARLSRVGLLDARAKNEASSNETTVVSVRLSAYPFQEIPEGIIRLVHVRAPDTRKLRVTRYPFSARLQKARKTGTARKWKLQ